MTLNDVGCPPWVCFTKHLCFLTLSIMHLPHSTCMYMIFLSKNILGICNINSPKHAYTVYVQEYLRVSILRKVSSVGTFEHVSLCVFFYNTAKNSSSRRHSSVSRRDVSILSSSNNKRAKCLVFTSNHLFTSLNINLLIP